MADLDILSWIRDVRSRFLDRPAIECDRDTITYADLVVRIDAIADRLRAKGVTPGARVGVHMRRSHDLVAALLAIWDPGAAYVPLPVDSPPARNALVSDLAELDLLVVDAGQDATRFPARGGMPLDKVAALPDGGAGHAGEMRVPGDGNALTYIMFTFVSTG
ncbi:MAG: AMP-binding protein [Breoghania sp.]|nr:AMP-binding protein [Breoghania sp.]MDJ0932530.1 AMP-binding protein [Breoghania sp.]